MKAQDKARWTTKDELSFLKGLGTFHVDGKKNPKPRLPLLKKYKKTIGCRSDWGDMDKEIILAFVNAEIKALKSAQKTVVKAEKA